MEGCGSSDKETTDDTSNATTAAPAATSAPTSAPGLHLVSQTAQGQLSAENHASTPIPFPATTGTFLLAVDADTVSFFQEANVTAGAGTPAAAHTTSGMLADLANRRAYSYSKQVVTGRPSQEKCMHVELTAAKDVSTVRKCMDDALQGAKPVGEQGGMEEYKMGSPGETEVTWFFDKAELVRKIVVDKTIPAPAPVGNITNLITLDVKDASAGADPALFKVPPRWGSCAAEGPALPVPHGAPPAVMAFLKCAGLMAASATTVGKELIV